MLRFSRPISCSRVVLAKTNPEFSNQKHSLIRDPLFYPLDSRNAKKLKNPKLKCRGFYKQQSYFRKIVLKKAKITISFSMKNSKNNNIILGFSF